MQFNSINFMIFFPIVVGVYFLIPRKLRGLCLLFASYYFYMSWNVRYAILMGGSTIITYACGLLLSFSSKESTKCGIRKKNANCKCKLDTPVKR